MKTNLAKDGMFRLKRCHNKIIIEENTGFIMEFTVNRTIKILAILLLLAVIIQPIYTLLYQQAPDFNRQILWSFEALIFTLMAAFAGAALVTADKRYALGFSAIAFSTVLNVSQVGIGILNFGPFRAAGKAFEELGPMAFSVVALSFFLYNAAKLLLGLAAIVFGAALKKDGKSLLGILAILAGIVALVTNAAVMMFGIQQGVVPRALAGGSGVVATFFLALCLFGLSKDRLADS